MDIKVSFESDRQASSRVFSDASFIILLSCIHLFDRHNKKPAGQSDYYQWHRYSHFLMLRNGRSPQSSDVNATTTRLTIEDKADTHRTHKERSVGSLAAPLLTVASLSSGKVIERSTVYHLLFRTCSSSVKRLIRLILFSAGVSFFCFTMRSPESSDPSSTERYVSGFPRLNLDRSYRSFLQKMRIGFMGGNPAGKGLFDIKAKSLKRQYGS